MLCVVYYVVMVIIGNQVLSIVDILRFVMNSLVIFNE